MERVILNIEDKLNSMKPKDTPLLVLGWIILGMFLLIPATANADNTNSITITQINNSSADDLVLNIAQEGYNNKVNFSLDHDDNTIEIKQEGNNSEISWVSWWGSGLSWGGDLDGTNNTLKLYQNCTKGSACNKNDIGFHISGNNNKLWSAQGYEFSSRTDNSWTKDNTEGGGHTANFDIHGNDNVVAIQQRNCSNNNCDGHTARIYVYANDNSIFGKQKADTSKNFELTIYNDDNIVDYLQDGNAAHSATITLNGTQPTTLNLTQHAGSAQSYSLSQSCVTLGGCSISITQD